MYSSNTWIMKSPGGCHGSFIHETFRAHLGLLRPSVFSHPSLAYADENERPDSSKDGPPPKSLHSPNLLELERRLAHSHHVLNDIPNELKQLVASIQQIHGAFKAMWTKSYGCLTQILCAIIDILLKICYRGTWAFNEITQTSPENPTTCPSSTKFLLLSFVRSGVILSSFELHRKLNHTRAKIDIRRAQPIPQPLTQFPTLTH
jgi:hypothetical protein